MYSVKQDRDSLTTLGQSLAALLERPEGQSIGNFASLIGRLHTELAMIGEQTGAADEDIEFSHEEFSHADWQNLLDEKLPAELLNAGERAALGGFLAQR